MLIAQKVLALYKKKEHNDADDLSTATLRRRVGLSEDQPVKRTAREQLSTEKQLDRILRIES